MLSNDGHWTNHKEVQHVTFVICMQLCFFFFFSNTFHLKSEQAWAPINDLSQTFFSLLVQHVDSNLIGHLRDQTGFVISWSHPYFVNHYKYEGDTLPPKRQIKRKDRTRRSKVSCWPSAENGFPSLHLKLYSNKSWKYINK